LTDQSNRKVLVVDDDPAIRSLLRTVLGRAGYTIAEAKNGREALNVIKSDGFSAMVLDLMMPEVSGGDVLDTLRAERPSMLGCVIVLTAASDNEVKRLDLTGVHSVVRKPFDLSDLVRTVADCTHTAPPEDAVK
jgi:CheY-like chemotaxis protein